MLILLVKAPLLGSDLEASLLALGHTVTVREPAELGRETLGQAQANGCAGVVSINHSPELALVCASVGLRYVSWTIDPLPHRRWARLGNIDAAQSVLFVHRRALVEPLRNLGHQVEWMPLACASRRWSDPPVSPSGPALFVGSSLQDERRILTHFLEAWGLSEVLPGIDGMLRDLALACLWDRSFPGFLRQPDALPTSLRTLLPAVEVLDLCEVLDAGLAWHFRRELVRILATKGVEIKGDDGWEPVAGTQWTGPLRNGREMTAAYRAAAINLDVPRFHQREIATLRAFDCLGSGGVLACEAGTELDELLVPGEHFLTWSNLDEIELILERAATRDPALRSLADAGQQAVISAHSLDSRAMRLVAALQAS